MTPEETFEYLNNLAVELPYVAENLFSKFSMKKLWSAIRAYVDERYEIDFSDEALQGEYPDDIETSEWLESYLQEKI